MSRRLFSSKIVSSDAFLDMPISTQALYFHLGMEADDDGFVNPQRIMRMVGASGDDLKVLLTKRFLLAFKSGVVVIKHWLIHNSIRRDRYHETQYLEEKNTLFIKENMAYTDLATNGEQIGNQMVPEVKLSKAKISKVKLSQEKENTPKEETIAFFKGESQYSELLDLYSKERDRTLIESEFKKFVLYWTESNGMRQRWQMQPVFDVKRRLYTWLSKINNFSNKQVTRGRGLVT